MASKPLVAGFKLLPILALHLKGAINTGAFVKSFLKTTNGTWQERSFKLAEWKRHQPKTSAPDVDEPLAPEPRPWTDPLE